ncbi:gamma-aminobutyric acid type B receptor subunit 1-like [Asterias rubens]|uniref:gamma-aminobutyric acid type B receptor subunit 1-like n=1 Tax=Asterias rubens TaxID=7604 RepID=UPI0014559DAF|nr:gamma-aminobutyric acid type B receptor subunit 1-like [Asterias rubens]
MTGSWPGGLAMSLATQLAVQDINDNPEILPGYEIVLIPQDTACDGGKATDSMYRELFNRTTTKMMIVGGGCSISTEPTAQASHHWNLIQISIAASPLLSNRDLFPRTFRLLPPESSFNVAKLAMFQEFDWTKVATLHQSVPLFSLSMADFHRDAKDIGIEIITAETFVNNPKVPVEHIKNLGARIIVAGLYGNMARKVFCEAYHHNLYGAKYVWIITGWLESNWWQVPDDSIDCTLEQMDEVTANQFAVYINNLPPDETRTPSISGLTTGEFLRRFQVISGMDNPESMAGYLDISLVYDTVWTEALAMHEAEAMLMELDPPRTLAEFDYDDVTVQILFDIISNMTFEGVSGPVKFNYFGDRLGVLDILQLQDGSSVSVGVLEATGETAEGIIWDKNRPIFWEGGAPPIDFIIEREDRQTIHLPVFITGVIFALLGIALACCFLSFNIYFRKLRVIKMSSPNINNLMLIGGILAYVSIIFLGVDTNVTSQDTFIWMCKAKTWCLSVGFSLAFGSMFSKTWRVHKIFTNKTAKRMVVKDSRLFSCVAFLVLFDGIILILWEVFDPLEVIENIGAKVTDSYNDDIVYTPIRMMCQSANQIYWIGAFYIINGLLLVFGAFLAWETRKVSIPALNDSKYIGICLYNIMILSFLGAPVSFVLEERNSHYILVSAVIWLATTLTLCVLFVPKIKTRNEVQPAQNTNLTAATAQNLPSTSTSEAKTELVRLRKEVCLLRKRVEECKCSSEAT